LAGAGPLWLDLGALVLLAGFAVAAALDFRTREVPDRLWQVLGIVGAIGGGVVVAPGGVAPVAVWVVVSALALEHMFAWDADGKGAIGAWADVIEVAAYVGVMAFVGVGILRWGIGANGVPLTALALLLTVIIARALFEVGVLYGGADAKALIIAGVLVPLFPVPWLEIPETARVFTSFVPFSVDLLMDAAVLSAAVPVAVAIRNLRRGEFSVRTGFTTYTIPVDELPHRYVWLRDPVRPADLDEENAIETSEEDRQWRAKVAGELKSKGIARVRVGPQLPFVVLMAAGAAGALLAGNWIIDLLAAL
jgi:hypothetical protein